MGVRATISPAHAESEPFSEWQWDAEIVIGGHLYEDSDEDGNFTIEMCGIDSFDTADEALYWVYRWLTSRGYDTNFIELVVKPVIGQEFHRRKVRA
jgi:hypothetical protein